MFLLGHEFLFRTDHAALQNLRQRDLPPTSRVERWILRIFEYTFKIEYQRGHDNIIADVLCRLPFAEAQESDKPISLDKSLGEIFLCDSYLESANNLGANYPEVMPVTNATFMIQCSEGEYDSDKLDESQLTYSD